MGKRRFYSGAALTGVVALTALIWFRPAVRPTRPSQIEDTAFIPRAESPAATSGTSTGPLRSPQPPTTDHEPRTTAQSAVPAPRSTPGQPLPFAEWMAQYTNAISPAARNDLEAQGIE